MLTSASFWKATLERVISTFLQTYFGFWLFGDVIFDAFTFDWYTGLGPALGAAVLSLVKAILASRTGNPGPSFANETLSDYPRVGDLR